MKRRSVLLGTALALSVALPAGARLRQNANPSHFFSGDTGGELTSCGCKTEDLGGLSRRAAFLDTLTSSGWDYPLLDAGGLGAYGPLNAQTRLKLETLCRALGAMGYDAVTVGREDVKHGPDVVRQIAEWLGQPLLATNFTLPAGTSEPSRIITSRQHTVGVIALMDPALADSGAAWVNAQPFASVASAVEQLAAQVDVVVALAQITDLATAERLMDELPQENVVLAGNKGLLPGELKVMPNGGIMGVGTQGKHLGRIELVLDADQTIREVYGDYLPVIKDWGFRPYVDDLIATYHRKMRELMFAAPEDQ